ADLQRQAAGGQLQVREGRVEQGDGEGRRFAEAGYADEARRAVDSVVVVDVLQVVDGRLFGGRFHAAFEGGGGPRRVHFPGQHGKHDAGLAEADDDGR